MQKNELKAGRDINYWKELWKRSEETRRKNDIMKHHALSVALLKIIETKIKAGDEFVVFDTDSDEVFNLYRREWSGSPRFSMSDFFIENWLSYLAPIDGQRTFYRAYGWTSEVPGEIQDLIDLEKEGQPDQEWI